MHSFATTHHGIEPTTQQEIKELLGKDATLQETVVTFDANETEIATLAYKAQSVKRTGILVTSFQISKVWEDTLQQFQKHLSSINFGQWLKNKTFKVESERIGNHEFNSQKIMESVGEIILTTTSTKVSMNPDYIVFVYTYNDQCYVGIDFSGFDLSKRDYKLFTHPSSLNGAIAYHLIRQTGLTKSTKKPVEILDPFCGGGTIAIEAALFFNNISPNYFRKDKFLCAKWLRFDLQKLDSPHNSSIKLHAFDNQLRYFSATRKNAKIANVEKLIHISKVDLEWLDTKFNKEELQDIVSYPPFVTRGFEPKLVEKIYKELFHQAEFILDKKGALILLMEDCSPVEKTMPQSFAVTKKEEVWQGEKKFFVVRIEHNKDKQ